MGAEDPEDELYHSASDEDFNPDAQDQDVESSSEDEPETAPKPKQSKRKRGASLDGELDSGDEATIQERQKRKRRKGKDEGSDDEGGEGGLIKTRAQRRQEKQERRPLARIDGATIDVDSLWARLSSAPIGRPTIPESRILETPDPKVSEEEYITIKRTTKFAGEVTTEERRVLKSSKEAQIYLLEQESQRKKDEQKRDKKDEQKDEQKNEKDGQDILDEDMAEDVDLVEAPTAPKVRRPLRRPSRFEPNPAGEVKALPPHLQLKWPRDKGATKLATVQDENVPDTAPMLPPPTRAPAAAKLNVVQKSRHDWAGYVDKEGIAEELDEHGKSKQSYLDRTDFLDRLEHKREADRLEAKAKTG